MEAARERPRVRLIVVDFLATLFFTFCIGVATALVLAACVMLMAGDAQGAAPAKPKPAAQTSASDLILAHYLAAKYVGLVAVDRMTSTQPEAGSKERLPACGCKS